MTYQVSNYHSKKALKLALAAGKKVRPVNIPLNKAQLKANAEAELQNKEVPFKHLPPLPSTTIELFCASNNQVPIWEAVVTLNELGFIQEVK